MTTTDIEQTDGEPGGDVELAESGGEVEVAGSGGAVVPAEGGGGDDFTKPTALLEPGETPRSEAIRTRVVLPILLPIVSAAAIFFYVINLSRVLLAGGKWGSLAIASILVLTILGMIAWISAHPNLRTGTLAIMVAVLFLFIGAAGLTTLGPSENKSNEAGGPSFHEPSGAPVANVEVVAQPGSALSFNATNFDTGAGVNEIKYVLGNGTHTLVFEEKEFNGFELAVGGSKKEDSGKVELKAGTTYTIYCTIPGHRAAGMEATVTVGEAPAGGESTTATTAAK
jgi:plastocyanin